MQSLARIPAGVEGYHVGNRYKPRRHRRVSEVPLHVLTGIGVGVALAAGFILLAVALW